MRNNKMASRSRTRSPTPRKKSSSKVSRSRSPSPPRRKSSRKEAERARSPPQTSPRGGGGKGSRRQSKRPRTRSRSPVERFRTRSRSSSRGSSRGRGRRGRSGDRYGRSRTPSDDRRRSFRSPFRRNDTPEPCRVLGVFGLSYHTSRRDLEREFGRFGKISRCDLVTDPGGFSRGFGFVSFDHQRDADYAREAMAEAILDGKRIRVDYSISRGPHARTPGQYMGDNRAIRRDYIERGSHHGGGGGGSWSSRDSPRRWR